MEWKKTPDKLVKFFEKKVADVKCEKRKMFGYPCCFINNNMFIGTHGENLVLRLGDEDRKMAMAAHKDIVTFEPLPGRKMGEYVVVPERVREDDTLFDRLLKQSVKYASSLPAKERKKRGSK